MRLLLRIPLSLLLCGLLSLSLFGCAYPRRSTSLSAIPNARDAQGAPASLWQLRIISAVVPPRQRSGHAWDEDDGPDPQLKLFRDEQLVFETPVIENTNEPRWDVVLPQNVMLPSHSHMRIELWDNDAGSDDIIGTWTNRGLPDTALPDAEALINLEGGASLMVQVSAPIPHSGVGITEFEVHSDHLLITQLERHSPAGRAGLTVGDQVVAIGGESVAELGEARSASALSLSSEQQAVLTVQRASGTRAQITLDTGFVWLQM